MCPWFDSWRYHKTQKSADDRKIVSAFCVFECIRRHLDVRGFVFIFVTTMFPYIPILTLSLLVTHCYTQSPLFTYSAQKEGLYGNVKSVTIYAIETPSSSLDTISLQKGSIQSVKLYSEDGLLLHTTYFHERGKAETTYVHGDDGRIRTISKKQTGTDIIQQDSFFYLPEQHIIVEKTTLGPTDIIKKSYSQKVYRLDEAGRVVEIEYLNSAGQVIRSTQLHYDNNSNLIMGESHAFDGKINTFFQDFDAQGRRQAVRSIDNKGNLISRTVFTQIEPATEQMQFFDAAGNIMEWLKTVSFKDAMGNVVKQYVYDMVANTGRIYFYE